MAELVGRASARAAIPAPEIDLESTLDGGQAFRWYRDGNAYRGVIGRRVFLISTVGRSLAVEAVDGAPVASDLPMVTRYLGLSEGLDGRFEGFRARYAADPVIGSALGDWAGLRLLRQDPWECLVGFITSATSSVPRIKQDVGAIASAFGRPAGPGPHDFEFPAPEMIATAGEARLRDLRLGFRAPYIVEAPERVASGDLDLDALRTAPYFDARVALMTVRGIGEKIADCVLAFSMDKCEAFPVDRWVKRALVEWYGLPERVSDTTAGGWARDRFGEDAVYVQQYLFHRQRMAGRSPGNS